MADSNNSAQDTDEQARTGGQAFGSEHGADPSQAGKQGAEAQPTEAKAEGGRHSHQGDGTS